MSGTRDGREDTSKLQNGAVSFHSVSSNNGPAEPREPKKSGDEGKVVKTKSFRELKALYEAKSTLEHKKDVIPIPPKPAPTGKRLSASPSPNRIGTPKPWQKEARSPPLPADADTSPLSSSGGASPPYTAMYSSSGPHVAIAVTANDDGSPFHPSLPSNSSSPTSNPATLRRSSSTEASRTLMSLVSSPRTGSVGDPPRGRRSWGRSKTANGSLCLTSSGSRLSDDSITDEVSSLGGVGDNWLKRITEEKGALERDDGPRSARDLSTAIEKGKVASVKEKFLVKGMSESPRHGRGNSIDFRDLSRSPSTKVSSRSQDNLITDETQPRRQRAATSSNTRRGGVPHNRSNSDSINSMIKTSKSSDGTPERETDSSSDGNSRLVRSQEEVVTETGPEDSWDANWQRQGRPKAAVPSEERQQSPRPDVVKPEERQVEDPKNHQRATEHERIEQQEDAPLATTHARERDQQQSSFDSLSAALNKIAEEEVDRAIAATAAEPARPARKSDAEQIKRRNSSVAPSPSPSPGSSPATSEPSTPERERRGSRVSATAPVLQAATEEAEGTTDSGPKAFSNSGNAVRTKPSSSTASAVDPDNKDAKPNATPADALAEHPAVSKQQQRSAKRASSSIVDRESNKGKETESKRASMALDRELKEERRVKSEIRDPEAPGAAVFTTSKSNIEARESSRGSSSSSSSKRRSRKGETTTPSPLQKPRERPKSERDPGGVAAKEPSKKDKHRADKRRSVAGVTRSDEGSSKRKSDAFTPTKLSSSMRLNTDEVNRGEQESGSENASRTPRDASGNRRSPRSDSRTPRDSSSKSRSGRSSPRESSSTPRASTPRTPRTRDRERDIRDDSESKDSTSSGSRKKSGEKERARDKDRTRRDKDDVAAAHKDRDDATSDPSVGGDESASEGSASTANLTQGKSSSSTEGKTKGHKSSSSGTDSKGKTDRKSRTSAHKSRSKSAKERLNGLDGDATSHRDSDEMMTETEATAVSEWGSETDKGTDTEAEMDTETDTFTEAEDSDGLKRSRGRDADVSTRHRDKARAEHQAESEEEEDELGRSDKDVLTVSDKASSKEPTPTGSPAKVRKGDDMSTSPASALFGTPSKQRRKENRRSMIFGKPELDGRKPKASQSIRSVYSAFLSRGGSSGVEQRKDSSGRSASLSEATAGSTDSSPSPSSSSSLTSSSRLVRTRNSSGPSSVTTADVLATEEREHEQGQDRQEQQEQVVSPPRQAEEVVEEDAEKAKERDRLAAVAAKLAKGKRLNFQEAVLIFNAKPTRAVKQLITNGFIRSDPDDIARFLHSANNSLDKEQLGILLAENEDIFPAVLQAFIGQMDFHMFDFDIALRKLLFTFRLPGEAQKIDRIVKVWASHWHDHNPGIFPEPKCAYVLAYAVIMLNTDAHNDMVRYKMTLKEFLVNVAHNDGGELIPPYFLEDIYPRIVEEEIRMEDEGALFPTASKKGWLQVRSKKPFQVWKRRWVVLTIDKIHILRKIGDEYPIQSIPLENLLMNTPIKDQGKKFLLFLYHAPTQERVGEHSKPAGAASAGASLKDKRLKDAERSKEVERKEAKGSKNSSDLLDLNDRVVTVLCAFEREVFDGWVASITKNIGIKSRLKKVSSTRF